MVPGWYRFLPQGDQEFIGISESDGEKVLKRAFLLIFPRFVC